MATSYKIVPRGTYDALLVIGRYGWAKLVKQGPILVINGIEEAMCHVAHTMRKVVVGRGNDVPRGTYHARATFLVLEKLVEDTRLFF